MGQPAARILDSTVHGGIVSVGTPLTIIGNMPAARMGDMHTCPMVTVLVPHVGGPIVFGAINVLVGGVPQARSMDPCICVGPPDMIAMGATTTLVGMEGAFAGGLGGFLALLLGGVLAGLGNSLGGYPRAIADSSDPNGYYTQYSKGIQVRGTPAFQQQVTQDLNTISSTSSGSATLARIDASGHTTTIRQTNGGNGCDQYTNPAARMRSSVGGPNGAGTDSYVDFNPTATRIGNGSQPWMTRPTDVGLFHELHHAADAGEGSMDPGTSTINGRTTNNREAQAVGLGPYASDANTENSYRSERGQPRRTYY
jgi:uncharacterized Zn-binding protein involved in type VI secretion